MRIGHITARSSKWDVIHAIRVKDLFPYRIIGGRVLRAALEPSRSFAAIFAGKSPWDLPSPESASLRAVDARSTVLRSNLMCVGPKPQKLFYCTEYKTLD